MQYSANYDLIRNEVADKQVEAIPTKVGKVEIVKASEIYKKYSPYYANRGEGTEGMNMARVKKIARSIIGTEEIPPVYNGTYWLVNPIIVNAKTKMIVDGHYTAASLFEVYKTKGWDLPAMVIEREFPKGLSDMFIVSMFNNCRNPWGAEAYIECYVMEGKEDYIKLKNAAIALGGPFVKKNGKPNYRYVSALVGSCQAGTLKKGDFKFNPAIIERGERVKELFYAISSTKQTSSWFESFITAYVKQEEVNRNAFKVFMKYADMIVVDGSTNEDAWNEQFSKIWDMVLAA